MKRFMLFSLMVIGLILAMNMTSVSDAGSSQVPAAKSSVGVEAADQEAALIGRSDVVSQASTCVKCLAQAGACNGGAGTVCSNSPHCTCQFCGGSLDCRPSSGHGPKPVPDPEPVPES